MKIDFKTTEKIRYIIDNIGRTEDVTFSPDNSRFIIAEFIANKLHFFNVEFDRSTSPPGIAITNYCKITSPDIKNPHGVCFLDDERIVVCSRYGDVSVFSIPDYKDEINDFDIRAEASISSEGLWSSKVTTPGSVDSYQLSENRYRIFVCNNHSHLVTSHIVDFNDDAVKFEHEGVRMKRTLRIPDGISISPDQKWLAVSNHVHGQAAIFENTPNLNKKTEPANVLEGSVCPHGLRFSPDGKMLYVADAATQYLFIYESEDGNWGAVQNPPRTIKVVDDEPFYFGQYGAKEGGVKGLDIDQTHSFLISTHRMGVIEFFDVKLLKDINHEINETEFEEQRRLRDETFADDNDSWLSNHWPFGLKMAHFLLHNRYLKPSNYVMKLNEHLTLRSLRSNNRGSEETLTYPGGPVVSLTSHGNRIDTVFYTIESIRQGSIKPSRVILWLDEDEKRDSIPETLQRLQTVGLEIYYAENIGPHQKYYGFIEQSDDFDKPLITADDDVIYPEDWLKVLIDSWQKNPSAIHCYRTYQMRLRNGKFMAHNDWHETQDNSPSHLNQITGVSGVIYPPKFLEFLKEAGDRFRSVSPTSDDIWLTVNALRSNFKIAQIDKKSKTFKTIPGTQNDSLFMENVIEGKNHSQLIQAFTKEDFFKLESSMNKKISMYSYTSKSSALT